VSRGPSGTENSPRAKQNGPLVEIKVRTRSEPVQRTCPLESFVNLGVLVGLCPHIRGKGPHAAGRGPRAINKTSTHKASACGEKALMARSPLRVRVNKIGSHASCTLSMKGPQKVKCPRATGKVSFVSPVERKSPHLKRE